MILDKIVEHKKIELAERKAEFPIDKIEELMAFAPRPRDFTGALVNGRSKPAVIAEVKKASPSKGVIRQDFDPLAIARAYEESGASAISVLTDSKFFQGSIDYLRLIREKSAIPVLRKDFIIDSYQIWEAYAAGADAVLLIVAILSEEELCDYLALTHELGMTALVETHSKEEVEIAVKSGAKVIGINNRNLQTFEVTLDTTLRLASQIPEDRLIVSESGIFTREDVALLEEHKVDAILVGEALMRQPDPGLKLKELLL